MFEVRRLNFKTCSVLIKSLSFWIYLQPVTVLFMLRHALAFSVSLAIQYYLLRMCYLYEVGQLQVDQNGREGMENRDRCARPFIDRRDWS